MGSKAFDVVIIGSGLGGLLCGAILAKNNRRVCLLEKHHQIGGNLQTFSRKGTLFNSAMHYVGSLDEGQVLYKVFTYLGIYGHTGTVKMNSENYEQVFIGDNHYTHANGIGPYRDRLLSYFPRETKAIEIYLQKIQDVWNSTKVLNLQDFRNLYDVETQYTRQNAYDFIEGLTRNRELKALLGVNNALYAGIPELSPLITHAIITYHYLQSAYKFSKGSDQLAISLQRVIESHGGEIRNNHEVSKLQFAGNNAVAAELVDGTTVRGTAFISNIHPVNTVKLVEPGMFRKAYVKRIEGLENTIGSFCVYVKLKKGVMRNIDSNVFISINRDTWYAGFYDIQEWPSACMLYTTPDLDYPGFADSLAVSTFMKYSELKAWEHTTVEQRGSEYRAMKKEKAEKLIALVDSRIPGVKDAVDTFYSATPLTFRDYTGIPGGSVYGILKDCTNPRKSYISPNTRVPNLFLTGQNSGVGLHGVLGVTVSALFTCANFLDVGKLLKEMRNE
jgi:all-trans-retinol 13,14-reductase